MSSELLPASTEDFASILQNSSLVDPNLISTSVPLPGSAKPGYSAVYRNSYAVDGLKLRLHVNFRTAYDLYTHAVANFGDRPCLGRRLFNNTKPQQFDDFYTWQLYKEVDQRRRNFGAGLLHSISISPYRQDHHPTRGFVVLLFLGNNAEWVIADTANSYYLLCSTALYDTLGPDASRYILKLTELPVVVCSNDKLPILYQLVQEHLLEHLVLVVAQQPLRPDDVHYAEEFAKLNVELKTFKEVEFLGTQFPHPVIPPTLESNYVICFTSGTTGDPKGVVVTQGNAAAAAVFNLTQVPLIKPGVHYLFLPLAHIYERGVMMYQLTVGNCIGFPQSSDPTKLIEDMQVLQPNSMVNVPRVFTRVEAMLKDKTILAPGLVGKLANHILGKEIARHDEGYGVGEPLFVHRKLLINKLRAALGLSNAKLFVTGSAPVLPDTLKFIRAALGVGFSQGYGMTETFSGVCFLDPYESDPGLCGAIGVTSEIRLREVPEMGYTANDEGGPRGELLIRGPQIFNTYYKNEKATAESFDEDGWFKTGDVARLDHKGRLYIIDRVKNFFKLAQGEYVTPERIENRYLSSCPFVQQLYVHGDLLQTYLVAIVGIDPVTVPKLLHRKGVQISATASPAETLKALEDPAVKRVLLDAMNAGIANEGLQGFEKINNIHCQVEPLTVARGVVTPTMKIQRAKAVKFFANEFAALYEEGSLLKREKL